MALFELCEGWENCEDEDFRKLYEKKMVEGKDFESLTEEEIEVLNVLCSKCKHPLKIEEKRCPICGNETLSPPKLIISGKAGSIKIYNYRCEPCDRVLYSHKKFIL